MTIPEEALEEALEEAPADAPARGPGFVLAVSLAVLFGLAAAVLAVLVAGEDGGDDRLDAVRSAAGVFGEALLTYDYTDPQAHRDAVLALATGSFRGEYEDAFEQGLERLITDVQASSDGTVKEIYVAELDEERGEVIVLADAVQDGTGGPRTVFDIYIKLSLVEVEGDWKVDDVADLNFTPGAGTTPTSVPVP